MGAALEQFTVEELQDELRRRGEYTEWGEYQVTIHYANGLSETRGLDTDGWERDETEWNGDW